MGFGANLVFLSFAWVCGSRLARPHDDDAAGVLRDLRWIFTAHVVLSALILLGSKVKRSALEEFWRVDLPTSALQACTLAVIYLAFRHLTVHKPVTVAPPVKAMRLLGDVSYPLYLIHIPVCIVTANAGVSSPYLIFGLCVLVSYLIYRVFDDYSQRRSPSPGQPAQRMA